MIKKSNQNGFTLIELSVVMVIIGLITAGFFAILVQQKEKERLVEVSDKMSLIRERLAEYVEDIPDQSNTATENFDHTRWNVSAAFEDDAVHYPCPAPLRAVFGDADFGQESRNTTTGRCQENSARGVYRSISPSGQPVFIGTVPTATLSIGSDYMEDSYGFKFTYAVADLVARDLALQNANPPGAIEINDNSSTASVTTADFLIFSHGEDGKGAYPISSSEVFKACTGSDADVENCNLDYKFTLEQYSESTGTNFYDDTAAYTLLERENNFFWAETPANQDDIYNLNAGNIGVGTDTPQATIDVAGEVRIGNTGIACATNNEGAMRYNTTDKRLEYCDATEWLPIGTSGTLNGNSFYFGDGFGMQWGRIENAGLNQQYYSQTFPIAFNAAPVHVNVQFVDYTIVNGAIANMTRNVTATGFEYGGDHSRQTQTADIFWVAFGLMDPP